MGETFISIYLLHQIKPTSRDDAIKIRKKLEHFSLENNQLHRKGYNRRPTDALQVMKFFEFPEVHSGEHDQQDGPLNSIKIC